MMAHHRFLSRIPRALCLRCCPSVGGAANVYRASESELARGNCTVARHLLAESGPRSLSLSNTLLLCLSPPPPPEYPRGTGRQADL